MDNLISRQAAIDLVRDVCDAILSGCGSHYDGEDEVYDDLLEVDAILKCNKEIRIALANMPSTEPERIRGRWSGFYSEPNDDIHIYGDKLMEGDAVYLLGVEGYVSCECGAWGWGSPNYVPWEQLESRMPHNNAPTFCYCDNFISFWELKWNFDDGNDWDGVPYIKHCPNCGADMRAQEGNE